MRDFEKGLRWVKAGRGIFDKGRKMPLTIKAMQRSELIEFTPDIEWADFPERSVHVLRAKLTTRGEELLALLG